MLFPTLGFLLFFLAVAAALAALGGHFTAKKAVLVIASYGFYAAWDWHFCFLLLFSTALSYAAGLLLAAARRRERRRAVLAAAVGAHLLLLGLERELPFIEVILPVGISFFTFHGISYLTDVYRGDVAVCRRPLYLLLYMS